MLDETNPNNLYITGGIPTGLPKPKYEIRIFLKGLPGFIRYYVDTKEQAMDHFATIVSTGYRRINDRGQFEWFSPSKLDYIRIIGPGLDSNYPDEMVRT